MMAGWSRRTPVWRPAWEWAAAPPPGLASITRPPASGPRPWARRWPGTGADHGLPPPRRRAGLHRVQSAHRGTWQRRRGRGQPAAAEHRPGYWAALAGHGRDRAAWSPHPRDTRPTTQL